MSFSCNIPFSFANPSELITNFKNNFFLYHDLSERIKVIAERHLTQFSEEQSFDIEKAFEISKNRFFPVGEVRKSISLLSAEQMKAIFPTFRLEDDPLRSIKSYLESVDNTRLLALAGYDSEVAIQNAILAEFNIRETVLKGMFVKEGQKFFKQLQEVGKNYIHRFAEMAISFTGIFELWALSTSKSVGVYEASAKMRMFFKLLAFPTVLSRFFSNYFEKRVSMILTASTIATMSLFTFCYLKYFTPCPSSITGLTNLKAKLMKTDEPLSSKSVLRTKIMDAFEQGKGVILVGRPGSGKTMAIKSIVKELLIDKVEPTKLEEAFYETANNVNQRLFSKIRRKFEGYEENVLFFFEEFAGFFKAKSDKSNLEAQVVDSLKAFLDDFTYVIGSTTSDEYETYIANNPSINQTIASGRRFVKIELEEVSESDLRSILLESLDYKSPQIDLEDGIIDYIIKKSKNYNPESTALQSSTTLLQAALIKLSHISLSKLKEELSLLEVEKNNLSIEKKIGRNGLKLDVEINKKTNLIREKESEIRSQNERIKFLKQLEVAYADIKRRSYELSQKAIEPNSKAYIEWLKNKVLVKALCEIIQKERISFGLFPCLNKKLIDSIINEKDRGEIKNQEKEVFQAKMPQDSEQEPGWDLM